MCKFKTGRIKIVQQSLQKEKNIPIKKVGNKNRFSKELHCVRNEYIFITEIRYNRGVETEIFQGEY